MSPVLPYFDLSTVSILGLSISTPGLLLVAGLVVGGTVTIRKAKRDGLESDLVTGLLLWAITGMIVGGHLGYLVFYRPDILIFDPVKAVNVFEGQFSFGGFVLAAIFGIIYLFVKKRKMAEVTTHDSPKINVLAYGDAIVYGLTPGWFFARAGCFLCHDHPGLETTFWLGVQGICPSGSTTTACHDLGLYESIFSLCFFFILTRLDHQPRFSGFYLGLAACCYGMTRFLLDILRHPDIDIRYFSLTPAQYGSIILMLIGIYKHARPPLQGYKVDGVVGC